MSTRIVTPCFLSAFYWSTLNLPRIPHVVKRGRLHLLLALYRPHRQQYQQAHVRHLQLQKLSSDPPSSTPLLKHDGPNWWHHTQLRREVGLSSNGSYLQAGRYFYTG
jgi:hypothetical protein